MAVVFNKETGKFEESKVPTWRTSRKITESFEDIIAEYQRMERMCGELWEENKKLKEGIWKEEEMTRLKKEYERMKADYYRGFPISEKEADAIRKFKDAHRQPFGVSGGGYTYTFVPTALGTSGTITAMNGDKFEFQEIG